MRIGIDFDDSISQTTKPLFEAMSEYFGKGIQYSDDLEYEWENIFGVTSEELQQAFLVISNKFSVHKTFPIFPHCKEVLQELKRGGHKLFVVSARPTWELPHTTVWLKYHGILPLLTQIIHKPPIDESFHEYKILTVKEYNLDIFVEDSPTVVRALSKANIPVIIIDHPYNQEIKAKNQLWRVKSWKEVPGIIKKIIQYYQSSNHLIN